MLHKWVWGLSLWVSQWAEPHLCGDSLGPPRILLDLFPTYLGMLEIP